MSLRLRSPLLRLAWVWLLSGIVFTTEPAWAERVRTFPLLLLHGHGSSFDGAWGKSGIDDKTNQLYADFPTGAFQVSEALTHISGSATTWNHKFFAMSFGNPTGSIRRDAQELDRLINGDGGVEGIRMRFYKQFPELFGSPKDVKIIVLAHSKGGLAAREYMRSRSEDHGIARLVTLATPHEGTNFVNVLEIYDAGEKVAIALSVAASVGAAFFPALAPALTSVAITSVKVAARLHEFLDSPDAKSLRQGEGLEDMVPGSSFLAALNALSANIGETLDSTGISEQGDRRLAWRR